MTNPIDNFVKHEVLQPFEKGVRDALVNKRMNKDTSNTFYNKGFSFGLTLFIELDNSKGE